MNLPIGPLSPAQGGRPVHGAVVPEAVVAGGVTAPHVWPGPGLQAGELRRAGVGPLDARRPGPRLGSQHQRRAVADRLGGQAWR